MSAIEKEKEKYVSCRNQAFVSYVTNVEPVLTDDTSLRQDIQRTIQEADVKLALYQLSSSLTTYKKFLDLIRMLNEQNKKIMNISDEELSAIFKGGSIRTF
jgi:hypothetical protein